MTGCSRTCSRATTAPPEPRPLRDRRTTPDRAFASTPERLFASAEPFSEPLRRQQRERQGGARPDRQAGCVEQVLCPFAQHPPPCGCRRRNAETEEGEPGFGDDHASESEGG